jgi:predicted histidine transporter YuiF (NhaC family)
MFVINYQKLRIGLMIFAIILLIYQLIQVNFSDLSWSVNSEQYLMIFASVFLFIGGLHAFIYYRKSTETNNEKEHSSEE